MCQTEERLLDVAQKAAKYLPPDSADIIKEQANCPGDTWVVISKLLEQPQCVGSVVRVPMPVLDPTPIMKLFEM